MKPKCFYDVVIEVAIIRPGPIQGDMVHPYLARRAGREKVTYFHADLEPILKPILERTLGVPLFQEQMLKIAMVVADFSGDEAEELRRALSFHRSQERMEKVSVKLRAAMTRKNIAPDAIEKIMQSITSFALYGFPESHAISFAILAYGSAYLKVHRAAEFYASLLNNQPMGFYSSATLVKDAHRHGVKMLPVAVDQSVWKCTVVSDDVVRLGFCVVNGLRQEHTEQLVRERERTAFQSIQDFKSRTQLTKEEMRHLGGIRCVELFLEASPRGDVAGGRTDVSRSAHKRVLFHAGWQKKKFTIKPDDDARARESRLRHYESDDRPAPDEIAARKFAGYLARDGPRARATWRDRADCWERYLPSTPRDRERICLYQSRRRNRSFECNCCT